MADSESADQSRQKKIAIQKGQRVLALIVTVSKVYDPEAALLWMNQNNLESLLSPAERTFIHDESPAEEARVCFSWRAEALVALLWALNAIPNMPPLNEVVDVFGLDFVRTAIADPDAFLLHVELRDPQEIDEMENYLYHQHWRVRDAAFVGIGKLLETNPNEPPIEQLNPSIVYERRYAMSWLAGWGDDWDHVPTDT